MAHFESRERMRYRIRLAGTGQGLAYTARLSIEGDAVCVVVDQVLAGRRFCGVRHALEGEFRSAPTDGRPASLFRQVPGNPEGA